jgi:hypothetical protein
MADIAFKAPVTCELAPMLMVEDAFILPMMLEPAPEVNPEGLQIFPVYIVFAATEVMALHVAEALMIQPKRSKRIAYDLREFVIFILIRCLMFDVMFDV